MDITKAFEVENGLSVEEENGGPFYTGGSSSPLGLDLPTRTIYVQNTSNGISIWKKFNTGVNDWRIISAQDVPFDVSSLTSNSADLTGLTQTQQVVSAIANRHFGKNASFANTSATLTTNSTSFQNIQTITMNNLPSGTYLIAASCSVLKTLLAGQVELRFLQNGSTAYSLGEVSMDDDDFWYQTTIFTTITMSGNNTINLQFRKASGGGDISARNRVMVGWRLL